MIDILIPVLGRPQNAQPLVESIRANTTVPHTITFIATLHDDEQSRACRATAADKLLVHLRRRDQGGRGEYAAKINSAFADSDSEWVFQGADDLRFHPGWDVAALEAAGSRYGVVGTNDLHNRAVRKGLHSTHSLIRRSYIEQYGSGTLDNSGLVLSEVYDHQFVDNELVEAAQYRGEFVFAEDSHVEHLHPLWKLAERDDTYRKAMRATDEDARLYRERSQQFYKITRRRPSRSRS